MHILKITRRVIGFLNSKMFYIYTDTMCRYFFLMEKKIIEYNILIDIQKNLQTSCHKANYLNYSNLLSVFKVVLFLLFLNALKIKQSCLRIT